MPITRRALTLENYVLPVRVGLYEAEKRGAQPVRFHVEAEVKTERQPSEDAASVLDYDRLREDVAAAAGERRYALLETLLETIIERLSARSLITALTVSATKTSLFDDGSSVAVTISWRRDD